MDKGCAPVASLYFSRKERRPRLEALLSTACARWTLSIVKIGNSLLDGKYAALRVEKAKGFSVYRIAKGSAVGKGAALVLRLPWYRPTFHLLFGEKDLGDKLGEIIRKDRSQAIDAIERSLAREIVGHIEPVDDVLECYGTKEFGEMIATIGST